MSTDKRKQKVLHTRVPEDLERELKAKAAKLGISVSNLVRNVLHHTLDLVEDVIVDSARIADSAHHLVRESDDVVLGWQELVLNLNALCVECNGILPRGTRAAIGVRRGGGAPPTMCMSCLSALISAPQEVS